MTHIRIPCSLNRLGIDGLALVHPAMVLSESRTIHRDTALVSMQHPLVLYYVVLAAETSKNHFSLSFSAERCKKCIRYSIQMQQIPAQIGINWN